VRTIAVSWSALALALSACGGPSEEEQVRQAAERFGQAVAAGEYTRLCEEMLAKELVSKLSTVALPCPVALARGWENVQRPTLRVLEVKVRSERLALVQARTDAANQEPLTATLRMVKENGAWRVASLSGAQPPAPPRPSQETP
jgi:hypothetical protein